MKMRKLQRLFVILAAVWVSGCDMVGVRGSGNVVSEPRSVSGFTSVDLSGSGQLIIDQNGTESLTITADDNLLPYLTSEVRGGELVLGTRSGTNIDPSRKIVYRLTAKSLDGIGVSGSGEVEARGIKSERLKIGVSGSGELDLSGNADHQDIQISGSGDYRGQGLTSKVATVSISGSGSAALAVSEKLDADISGSGSVEYAGSPVLTQHVSGSGSIQKR